MTATIRVTKRQHSLLSMDVVDIGTTPETQPIADELERGRTLAVTATLLAELREFCDRDDDPIERAAYRHLYAKALKASEDTTATSTGKET